MSVIDDDNYLKGQVLCFTDTEDEFINKVRNSENLFIVDDNKTKLNNINIIK